MIIAHRHDHAAMGRGSSHIGVPHHVTRAIDARTLAVPQPENAVVFTLTAQFGLLCAPQRRRGQILIQTGLKGDLMRGQVCLGPLHLHINRAKR